MPMPPGLGLICMELVANLSLEALSSEVLISRVLYVVSYVLLCLTTLLQNVLAEMFVWRKSNSAAVYCFLFIPIPTDMWTNITTLWFLFD
jgi:hypothetical protein